jgi:hypothetical protein
MLWFIPSVYGDVRLVTIDPKTCKVLVEEATPQEKEALEFLRKAATAKKWIPEGQTFGVNTTVNAPIERVAKLLAKILKPSKKLVSAVKYSNGKIEEVTEQTFRVTDPKGRLSTPDEKAGATSVVPVAATTVQQPTRGCPAPAFSPAELRAREVLFAFLTPEQREDFERYNRFVTTGGTTGHRYMITSRHANDQLKMYHRTLFDLDEKKALCVHDWDIPAEEEMHNLNVLIQLSGYESYCRYLEN